MTHQIFKKIILLFSLALMLALLNACAKDVFGVPEEHWNTLSAAEKKKVMNNYYRQQEAEKAHQAEIERINAQNEPMNILASGVASSLYSAVPKRQYNYSRSKSTTHVTHTYRNQ